MFLRLSFLFIFLCLSACASSSSQDDKGLKSPCISSIIKN